MTSSWPKKVFSNNEPEPIAMERSCDLFCDITYLCIALPQSHRVVLSQGCLVAISQYHEIADRLIVIIIMCNLCDFCDVRYAISHIGDFKVFQRECSLMHAMRWIFASQSRVFYHFGSLEGTLSFFARCDIS